MDTKVINKQLGLRLKKLRLAKGLRQEDLERWGFSYRHYGKLERGLVNPTVETLAKLCKIFGITLSDLFLFICEDKNTSEEREQVIEKLTELLNEDRKIKIKKLKILLDEIL